MVSNRTDLELIISLVDKEARILDVGCGNGELLKSLKSKKNVFLDKKKCISFANKNKMFILSK